MEQRSIEVICHILEEEWKRGVDHLFLSGSGAGSSAPILGSGAHHCALVRTVRVCLTNWQVAPST